MRKFTIIFISLLIILFSVTYVFCDDYDEDNESDELELLKTVAPVNSEVKLNSRAAVIYERNSGMVLFEKNANSIKPMASTTKIMTCLVVLENADLNKVVTISAKAASIGGSRIKLKKGDKITIHDLLYGLMLRSGNDAAIALAEEVGGSIDGFANLMNKKAIDLGLQNTHFITPHGLDSNGHYTTAKELALLTDYALNNPRFREIVGMHSYILTINGQSRTINNTNELLGYLNGVYGVKTGFTNGAGRCLVTSTKRENMDIICVVLGADTKKFRTQDSMKLIEYAFKNFQIVDLKDRLQDEFEKLDIGNNIQVLKGKTQTVNVGFEDSDTVVAIRTSDIDNIEIHANFAQTLLAPIEQNRIIGKLSAIVDDIVILEKDIFVTTELQKKDIWDYMNELMSRFASYVESSIQIKN